MIQDHLNFRARLSGHDIAIHYGGQAITFEELRDQVRAVAASLRQFDLPPGSIVSTCMADKALDWVLALAIHHEGLVSCSNLGYSSVNAFETDLWITDRALSHGSPARTWQLNADKLAALPAPTADFSPRGFSSHDSPVRLFLTSGTTGHRKVVALSEPILLERVKARSGVFEPQKILTPMPLGASVGFNNALLALVRGMPLLVAKSNEEALYLIEQQDIESFYGSPAQILGLLRTVATKGTRPAKLSVVKSTGGPLSPMLIRGVRQWLCPLLVNEYGATETGSAAICLPAESDDATITGLPLPGCEIEIVDAAHRPIAHGDEGTVRIRTPYMAQAYHGNATQTAESFRDGFFYPGDRGRWGPDGRLVLAGRTMEIINRGGVKIAPAMIDAVMLEQPHVIDAAAFAAPGPGGLQEVAAAVVAGDDFDAETFRAALHRRLGATREPKAILRLTAIPRNETGKVQREELTNILLAETHRYATKLS
jgi:long-chain acyl-CoA synthetase